MSDDQPLKPANILNIVAINQGKQPLTRKRPRAKSLTPDEVFSLSESGYVIVDARSSASFGAGHIKGSFNIQKSSAEFEQRVGWIVPNGSQIILVTEKDDEAQKCIFNMAFLGLDTSVAGYLEGGMDAWMNAGRPVETTSQIDVYTVKRLLSENGLQVLDVRSADEWDDGHIESAQFMAYTSLTQQLDNPPQIDKLKISVEQKVAVTCATGKRSSTAISILLRHGFKNLYNVTGGMEAWESAGFRMLDAAGNVCKT